MRIAQRMMTRNYLNSLNMNLGKQAASMERQTTGLKFSRLSQNVGDGTRAMRYQEERLRNESYLNTVQSAQLELKAVDSNLDSLESMLQSLSETVLKSMNDVYSESTREVLASQISSAKDQVLQILNAQFGDKYLFSNTANADAPFQINDDGKLTFNGIQVDQIFVRNGEYYYNDGVNDVPVPESGDIYVDIGLGMKTAGGSVDPRTAFQLSVGGLGLSGFGPADSDGTANNIIDLLTQMEDAVRNLDQPDLDNMHTKLVALTDSARLTRTEAGVRAAFLENTQDRLTTYIDNLGEMESQLISSDPAEEAINMKMYEYAWLATLQLGTSILPTSLLDFLR